ncbi:putative Zn-binding protein involved in type VI secretion [Cricetibacter osteomyelitidis]|uniref:Putative Zn-binding protein involved in type VI secretion n=1 Tax=Cricetibacter osteomyelitidis TaxID=1521931 RepID=A0A4R2SMC5_9PAST|nr:PAAR domain-containing protein [Cricetibacter osteomyelitidis]TCP91167.1 putative Zn-binding protein involved in type VI secretion [Cricetibacter osteomyelitidis]
MAKIALHGHYHSCPEHTGGEVIVEASGRPTINGVPVAIVGDKCRCGSGVDVIVTGSSLFTINGIPVAITGSKTAHGGIIVEGHASLTID